MLAQNCVHFILIFISSLIPLIFGDCITEADKCFDKFKSDLDNQMRQPLNTAEDQLSQICHPTDGSFNQFVNCIKEVERECHSDKRFRPNLCEKRHFKTRIYKFTWKSNFFYQLCHNTTPGWSLGFLKHEDCINGVFNTRKWKCDINYERVVKGKKDWKTDLNTTCSLWFKFRDCSKRDINQKCGTDASLISDHLFHSHQSYFDKYSFCNFDSPKLEDNCWIDLITSTNTQTPISSTIHPTNDMTENDKTNDVTENKIDSDKSSHLITINDNASQTQNSETELNLQTLKDTTDPSQREAHDDSWAKSQQNQSANHELDEQESNNLIATDSNETPEMNVNAMKESNERIKSTEQLTSGASTDSRADNYLLLIPFVIIFLIKLLI